MLQQFQDQSKRTAQQIKSFQTKSLGHRFFNHWKRKHVPPGRSMDADVEILTKWTSLRLMRSVWEVG